ncbi:methyltransferase [Paenibacillus sp. GYB003]|jgi:malonyl-CoA O-methyltransferase|uniref:methyltransferase n=1 Tax=Paenibacillus sp. GYB003 TaxID=2994392 RepID=UPI002F967757
MDIDKSLVRLHFDRHAHEYERYASVQRTMAKRLAQIAAEAVRQATGGGRTIRRVLEIGSGTGMLTALLAESFPEARIVCIDLSANMIEAAERKLRRERPDASGRVSFMAGDAEAIVVGGDARLDAERGRSGFDLIASNAAFQWFNAPRETAGGCLKLLRPDGGVLAFSTFGPGTFRQLHDSFAAAEEELGVPGRRHGQTFWSGGQWEACFAGAPGAFEWSGHIVTETSADVRSFLHTVKRVGAGNALQGAPRGAGGRKVLEAMERIYAERFAAPGGRGIAADYEIVYGTFSRRGRADGELI